MDSSILFVNDLTEFSTLLDECATDRVCNYGGNTAATVQTKQISTLGDLDDEVGKCSIKLAESMQLKPLSKGTDFLRIRTDYIFKAGRLIERVRDIIKASQEMGDFRGEKRAMEYSEAEMAGASYDLSFAYPDNLQVWHACAMTLTAQGYYEKAAIIYEKALRHVQVTYSDSDHPYVLAFTHALAGACFANKKKDRAVSLLQTVVEADNKSTGELSGIADCQETMGLEGSYAICLYNADKQASLKALEQVKSDNNEHACPIAFLRYQEEVDFLVDRPEYTTWGGKLPNGWWHRAADPSKFSSTNWSSPVTEIQDELFDFLRISTSLQGGS